MVFKFPPQYIQMLTFCVSFLDRLLAPGNPMLTSFINPICKQPDFIMKKGVIHSIYLGLTALFILGGDLDSLKPAV
jgi:hypothetical protein